MWLKDISSPPRNDHSFVYHAGHVGSPMPCNLIKLVDVEEMNYLAAKGEGEVSEHNPRVIHLWTPGHDPCAATSQQCGREA